MAGTKRNLLPAPTDRPSPPYPIPNVEAGHPHNLSCSSYDMQPHTCLHGFLAMEFVASIQNLGDFLHCSPPERLTTPTSSVAGIVMRVKDCRGLGLAFLRPCSSQNKLADSPGSDAGLEAASAGSAVKAHLPSRESQECCRQAWAEKSETEPRNLCTALSWAS